MARARASGYSVFKIVNGDSEWSVWRWWGLRQSELMFTPQAIKYLAVSNRCAFGCYSEDLSRSKVFVYYRCIFFSSSSSLTSLWAKWIANARTLLVQSAKFLANGANYMRPQRRRIDRIHWFDAKELGALNLSSGRWSGTIASRCCTNDTHFVVFRGNLFLIIW